MLNSKLTLKSISRGVAFACLSVLALTSLSQAATSYYMARECRATEGRIIRHETGEIENPSQTDIARVQCPIVRRHHGSVENWEVLVRDVNTDEDISCFLQSRTVLGALLESATATTPSPGYTGVDLFEYNFGIDTSWYPGTGGSALSLVCELPSAVGSHRDDRSKIFMYKLTETE